MEKIQQINDLVLKLFNMMSLAEPQIVVSQEKDSSGKEFYLVNVTGSDLGILIGYRGKTLKSLQMVLSIMSSNIFDPETVVLIDINGYWESRANSLKKMVDYFAQKMREKGENEYDLQPMDARERKVIHEYVSKIDGLTTRSEGEGEERRIVLVME
jgi:spoIIIJ-associated protein